MFAAVGAIMDALTDEDIDSLVNKCLSVCYEDLPAGLQVVIDRQGNLCVDDIEYDMQLTIRLCYEAIKWIGMAAELGNAEALFNMGIFYLEGMGCDQDMEKCASYLHRAARRRHPEAQFAYADLLSNGWGVEQDEKRAAKWYLDAAENGQVEAMYRLGEIYEEGRGVEADLSAAAKWYNAACEKGHRMAAQKLVMVKVKMQEN